MFASLFHVIPCLREERLLSAGGARGRHSVYSTLAVHLKLAVEYFIGDLLDCLENISCELVLYRGLHAALLVSDPGMISR